MKFCSAECRFLDVVSAFDVGDECWEWPLSIAASGYGQMNVATNPKPLVKTAHRLSYEMFIGEIPDGLFVMHKCDNRKCFNPEHLSLGTPADNIADMMRKGRYNLSGKRRWLAGEAHPLVKNPALAARGEANSLSKLTESQAIEILRSKDKQIDIARSFGICRNSVSNIKKGITWAHLGSKDKTDALADSIKSFKK